MIEMPRTGYAKSGNLNIAYQVVGNGPIDLVLVPGFVSHVELHWEDPLILRMITRVASFARLIMFDKRGTGMSDRVAVDELPTLEQRMDDVRAVMDAAGSERAALVGASEGGSMCALFAATYPERTSALVIYGGYARYTRADDYPWAPTREQHEGAFELMEAMWGEVLPDPGPFAPSMKGDMEYAQRDARFCRLASSPGAAVALYRMNTESDVRAVLPAIRVPTLVLHRIGDRLIRIDCARDLATKIPGAKLVELEGVDHLMHVGDSDAIIDEIEEFLTGARGSATADRILATVLFTDIVGSTERVAEIGDRAWRHELDRYDAAVRVEIGRHNGREIDTAGDGFFAAFDGPARAIRCGQAISAAGARLGVATRIGIHTGECEVRGDNLAGIAVHVGARVAALAGGGEVLVTSTVRDLVAGSGITFVDRGTYKLKGVPDEWHVFEVAATPA